MKILCLVLPHRWAATRVNGWLVPEREVCRRCGRVWHRSGGIKGTWKETEACL